MPNYGLVITPQYNPMSYEQYIAPFREYAGVYNQMADAYDTLEMEANQWEKLAQNVADAPQYNQYKKYADDLRNAASDLATNGLNQRTRGTLSGLRKRYAQEIKPISDAYQMRLEDIKAEDALIAKDPSLVLAQSARDRGLGEYMSGTPQRYGVSGNDVYAKTLAAFKAISGRDVDFKQLRRFGNTYWGLQKITGEENPARMLEALDAMKNNPELVPEELKRIIDNTGDPDAFYQYAQAIDNVLGSTYYDKLTPEGKDKIMQSALLGGNTGIVYDVDERDYQNWYLQHTLSQPNKSNNESLGTLISQPSIVETVPTTTVNESKEAFNKEIDKIIDDMTSRELVITENAPRRSGESALISTYSPGKTTRSKYYKDMPSRDDFSNTGDYYKAIVKAIDDNISSWEKVKDHPKKDEVLTNLKKDKTRLEKAISDYKNKLAPYSRIFSFNPDNFIDDQTAAAISDIQQAHSRIAHNEFALTYEDSKFENNAKTVLAKKLDMANRDKSNKNMGVFLVEDAKGNLEKVTDAAVIKSLKDGTLTYDTNLGIIINLDGSKYVIKDGGVYDKIKKIGKQMFDTAAFSDAVYGKDFDKTKRIATRENGIPTKDDVVYQDSDINIFEYRTKDGNIWRVIADKNGTPIFVTSIEDMISDQKAVTESINSYVLNGLIDWSAANVITR